MGIPRSVGRIGPQQPLRAHSPRISRWKCADDPGFCPFLSHLRAIPARNVSDNVSGIHFFSQCPGPAGPAEEHLMRTPCLGGAPNTAELASRLFLPRHELQVSRRMLPPFFRAVTVE